MASVTLTAALRSNLLTLQGTQSLLDTTQFRLATGKKVNSALDNASAFFSALNLNNRATDLSSLLDSQTQAIQVLKAADQGITSLTALVKQAQAIAQSAQSSLSSSGAVRSGDISVAIQSSLTAAYAGTFTMTNGGTATATITITAGDTLASVAASINASTGFTAVIVEGSSGATTGAKRLEIRATSGAALTLTNTTGTPLTGFQAANGGAAAGVVGMRLDTGGVIASAAAVAATSNTPDAIALENQYNVVRTQITQLIADTGYKGTNLLNGDTLNVQFNENNSSKLAVTGVTFNASGLGISFTASGPGATTGRFHSSTNITAALNELTSSLSTLRVQAQSFGNNLTIVQTRKDFTSNLINVLQEGADALTVADKNEEGANLLSLQTTQQLGIQALSLASQANQSVLRLFA